MPIDNSTLMKHTPPLVPRRPRPGWIAPVVLVLTTLALVGCAVAVWGDDAWTRIAVLFCVVGAGVWSLWRLAIGWTEDGLLGLFYREEHAMGTILAGDEERDGLVVTWWWLSSIAVVIVVVLMAKSPYAFAAWGIGPKPPGAVAPAGSAQP